MRVAQVVEANAWEFAASDDPVEKLRERFGVEKSETVIGDDIEKGLAFNDVGHRPSCSLPNVDDFGTNPKITAVAQLTFRGHSTNPVVPISGGVGCRQTASL